MPHTYWIKGIKHELLHLHRIEIRTTPEVAHAHTHIRIPKTKRVRNGLHFLRRHSGSISFRLRLDRLNKSINYYPIFSNGCISLCFVLLHMISAE